MAGASYNRAMVTHDIVEAAALADTVLVFTPRPSRAAGVVDIDTLRESRNTSVISDIQQQISALSVTG